MKKFFSVRGFTLIEIVVAIAIFLIFSAGIYSTLSMVFKIVYQSRLKILETAVLSEQLEIARNLPYDSVGILNGVPAGVLLHTQTIVRDGATFTVLTTVRNIDDVYDGTLGGTPNDTAPADYKHVEVSAICNNCLQQTPTTLSTIVSPKNLEGASQNGALFIHVFDANGLPISQANVHIINSAVVPNIIIDDVTDNNGDLKIIDAPTGTLSYHLTVSKSGYSSDSTVTSSASNPNPLKPPANVVSQTITEISFSIDKVSNLVVSSVNQACDSVTGPTVNLRGNKIIGVNPDVYKTSKNFSLSSGSYNLDNLEWDTYHISVSGTAYDLAGSVPMLPLKLNPNVNQSLSLILKNHTTNSLLVKVKDAGTGLPLSDAVVRLYNGGFDDSVQTDLGYMRQTDWSNGGGQVNFLDETKYFSDDGNLENSFPAGDLKLKKTGNTYALSGQLESSTFDLGGNVTLRNLISEPISQSPQSGTNPIRFQLAATSTLNAIYWNFVGPDGTANSYYTSTNTLISSDLSNKRYLRYKVFLSTADNRYTPQLSEIDITYTNSCTPPGQVSWAGLSAGTYTLDVSHSGYSTNSGVIDISGNNEIEVNLSPL